MENITIPFHFAPLQGFTDYVYRNAHARWFGGIHSYYTPFIRIERGKFRNRDVHDVNLRNNSTHLIPQIIASEPEELERLIVFLLEYGYNEIDLNWGCPFSLMTRKSKGAGILLHPDKVSNIGKIIRNYPEISFSVKMRLGMKSPDESVELLPMINEIPLKHLTVHPRTGVQQYKGNVDMGGFRKILNECRHPVIYNGDIINTHDIIRLITEFPNLSGIMIGRGLLMDPALAANYLSDKRMPEVEYREKIYFFHQEVMEGYIQKLEGGDSQLLNKMKIFWEYLLPEMDKKTKKAIRKSISLNGYISLINNYFSR